MRSTLLAGLAALALACAVPGLAAAQGIQLRGTGSSASPGAVTIIPAQGAGIRIYVAAVQCTNTSSAPILVTLNDSALTSIEVGATSTDGSLYPVNLVVAANMPLTFTPSVVTAAVGCSAQGQQGQ